MSDTVSMWIDQTTLNCMKFPPGLEWALDVEGAVIQLEENDSAANEETTPPLSPGNLSESSAVAPKEDQNKPSGSRRRKQQILPLEETPKPAKKQKELPLYNRSLDDPTLTPSEIKQIKKSTKCKNFRDKKSDLLKALTAENVKLRIENENLKRENANLRGENERMLPLQVLELFGQDF